MKKVLFSIITFCVLTCSTTTFAQNFIGLNADNFSNATENSFASNFDMKKKRRGSSPRQSAGAALFLALDGQASSFYGINYNFAFPLKELDNGGFYIAANPTLGGAIEANSQTGGGFVLGVDLPIMAEMHFGDEDAFGGIFGLGLCYSFINSSNQAIPHKALGPVAAAAVRFNVAQRTYIVKASYTLNLTKKTVQISSNEDYSTGNIIGLSVCTGL
jgi:hypothetical protein